MRRAGRAKGKYHEETQALRTVTVRSPYENRLPQRIAELILGSVELHVGEVLVTAELHCVQLLPAALEVHRYTMYSPIDVLAELSAHPDSH